MTGHAANGLREILMRAGQAARTGRVQGAGAVVIPKSERRDDRDDEGEHEHAQAPPVSPNRAHWPARRRLNCASALRVRSVRAGSPGARRSSAFPTIAILERLAFAHAAAGAIHARPAAARLSPDSNSPTAKRKIRPFVWAFILLEPVLIVDHNTYTFTKIRCQIDNATTASASGMCRNSHFFMTP